MSKFYAVFGSVDGTMKIAESNSYDQQTGIAYFSAPYKLVHGVNTNSKYETSFIMGKSDGRLCDSLESAQEKCFNMLLENLAYWKMETKNATTINGHTHSLNHVKMIAADIANFTATLA